MAVAPWMSRLGLSVAVGAAAMLLALPLPHTAAPAPTGPLTLALAWPTARMVDVAAALPDGGSFVPAAVLDAGALVGTIASADNDRTSLAVLRIADPGHPRILQTFRTADNVSINALAVAGRRVYWISGRPDSQGQARAVLYRADRDSGPVRRLTGRTGDATYDGSQYDLQVVDGRVYWIATHSTNPLTGELRSVGVDGGPVTVRPLGGAYGLSAWPWLEATATSVGQPVALLNLSTGQRRTIPAGPAEDVTCTPAWCKTIVSDGQNAVITLAHPDGRDRVRVNTGAETSVLVDVAALDRFELVAAPVAGQIGAASQRLAMYDLKTHRRILLGVATAEGVYGRWLWWSTGDHETLTWHLLDLATLR